MGEKVKRIKRELKYRGTILDMYCDHVEVNGHIAKWDYLQHKGAAAVIPVTKEGKILIAKNLIPSKQNLDEDESIDVEAYTMEELKEKIFSGEIEDSKTIASLMSYAVKIKA